MCPLGGLSLRSTSTDRRLPPRCSRIRAVVSVGWCSPCLGLGPFDRGLAMLDALLSRAVSSSPLPELHPFVRLWRRGDDPPEHLLSNSSMVTDEASPEGRSASVPSSAGSFRPMFRRSIRAGASMPQSITRDSVRGQRLAEVQVLTLSADAGWYAARRRTDAEDREGRRLRSGCGGTPRRGAVQPTPAARRCGPQCQGPGYGRGSAGAGGGSRPPPAAAAKRNRHLTGILRAG